MAGGTAFPGTELTSLVHGGDLTGLAASSGLPESSIIDASANLNPLGPPDWLDAAFAEGRRSSGRYPDPAYRRLRAAASQSLGVPPECLVFGNGADELMYALARALLRQRQAPQACAIVEAPSYASYRAASADAGFIVRSIPARLPEAANHAEQARGSETTQPDDEARYTAALTAASPGSVLWLGSPNNPTGLMPAGYPGCVIRLAERNPDRYIVCDEAFIEFAEGADPAGASLAAARLQNLVVLRSMTKFWAVPGLRAGYAICAQPTAAALRAALPNWPLNSVAESFAHRAFCAPGGSSAEDTHRGAATVAEPRSGGARSGGARPGGARSGGARREETRSFVSAERKRMVAALGRLPCLTMLGSKTNYYLVRVGSLGTVTAPDDGSPASSRSALDGDGLVDALAKKGIGIRKCRNFENLGPDYVRIAVRTRAENDAIAAAIAEVIEEYNLSVLSKHDTDAFQRPAPASRKKPRTTHRAKALMIQGCNSGAGKSLIAAAFCRIFRDEGIDVAPYKAQNMSLNSAVTAGGLEIGRAQAVQAAACGLEPDARMNPVLIKPESDRGSQIVLMGKPYGRYQAQEYYKRHKLMRDTARSAYDGLASERELIILEGAGSPAEINLKKHDFVNMAAARHAGARVLLVGDIDRGGVFASFIGHVATFAPDELAMLSGFVVNKFRGDPALLGDAFAMTRDRTGYPVLGCVPMVPDLDIPDEDEPVIKANARDRAALRIAVPRLPRVSNFTDLDAFASETDVEVVTVSKGNEIDDGRFDAVIIPGTKSTVADLGWLRASGLADAILRFAAAGGTVAGICGGYQMLGRALLDPNGIESTERETAGLGLLPVVTSFASGKTLARTSARWVFATGAATGATRGATSDEALEGYEIHHGATRLSATPLAGAVRPVVVTESGEAIGYGTDTIWGSYLHGIFDADQFRRSFLNRLRLKRGLSPLPPTARPSLDSELSRLADAVRANVDLAVIRAELRV
jgi:cobyric acid synthase CobQ